MGRCGCGSDQQCLSTNPGNLASYDDTGCLYVAAFTPLFGAANQPAPVDLVPLPNATWTDTGLSVTIPAAGTFEVIADAFAVLHVNISASGGTSYVQVFIRLWNNTAGALIPNTQAPVMSLGANTVGRYLARNGSSVHANVVTTGPTTIKMQVYRGDTSSGGSVASVLAPSNLDSSGTSLRYNRLA